MGCCSSKRESTRKSERYSVDTLRAIILIQRWHRRYLARLEMRRRATWNIFQNLEYASEQDQAELYKFFNDLLAIYPEVSKAHKKVSGHSLLNQGQLKVKFEDPDRNYTGPHLKFPLKKKDVDILIDFFRKKGSLHPKYVAHLLLEASTKLQELPNLNVASTGMSKQVTVVGDIHGKLEDLLVIFHKNGLPSLENPYVFNGDYVDRGKMSLEVFLIVLGCFLAFPGAVFPNRGNHEDALMNARYGFMQDIQLKYCDFAEDLLMYIEEVYRWLPIGTIINNKVLVVHGGISDSTNLDMLKRLNRSKYTSILRPPVDSSDKLDTVEHRQIFDVMWSDPQSQNGCVPNKARGAGALFGPDITLKFLSRYRFLYLIRSHECKPEGFEFAHNKRVVTIFSASNYYVPGSNRGAYMKLNQELEPHFVQYIAAASKTADLTLNQKVGVVEATALKNLGARLRAHRGKIEKEFQKYDPHGTGQITSNNWCTAMEKSTNLGLPWHLLSSQLAPGEALPRHLNYKSTLEFLDTKTIIDAGKKETSAMDSLYGNKGTLEAIFHILDKDNSGSISIDEFIDACSLLEQHLGRSPTTYQIRDMAKIMDENNDGLVTLNEFVAAFRLSGEKVKDHEKPVDKEEKEVRGKKRNSLQVDALVTKMNKNSEASEFSDVEIDPTDYEVKSIKE